MFVGHGIQSVYNLGICGGVVFLLAYMWSNVAFGEQVDDIRYVERALFDLAFTEPGKSAVKRKIGALLTECQRNISTSGNNVWEQNLRRRLNKDIAEMSARSDWVADAARKGGHVMCKFDGYKGQGRSSTELRLQLEVATKRHYRYEYGRTS